MSQLFHHPEFCDQYQVTANDNGSFFVEDVNHPLAYLNVKSWDDLNRLSDLIIVALSMTLPIPEPVGEASDDVPF
jgi:hypothetical protein